MADNLISIDPWMRSTFSDAWLTDAFTRDNEALTRALQKSLSSSSTGGVDNLSGYDFQNLLYSSEVQIPIGVQTHTPTGSGGAGGGGSEVETPVASRKGKSTTAAAGGTVGGVNGGKITKRKRRKSKRSTTIFISADPVNFRRMVQQVTGPKAGDNFQLPFFVAEPGMEQQEHENSTNYLPTFDTSAFLLEHPNQQQQYVGLSASSTVSQPSSVSSGVVRGGGGYDFGSLCSFPTLDSWNVI